MNVSKQQIDALVEWLSPRLEPLISHGVNVRHILDAAKRPDDIVTAAINFVATTENTAGINGEDSTQAATQAPAKAAAEVAAKPPSLCPEELAVWRAMLPLLAEHSILAVKGSGQTLEPDKPMTKQEAADYLGIKLRKLETCMKKRQIGYEKYGAGQTAKVRFYRAELDKYRASRMIPARQNKG
jgi:excisionase family DNA binding protein